MPQFQGSDVGFGDSFAGFRSGAPSTGSGMFGNGAGQFSPGASVAQYDDPFVAWLRSQPGKTALAQYCGPVPPSPPGVSADQNINLALYRSANQPFLSHVKTMYDEFRTGGLMDYKQSGDRYRDFGNFNYGAYSTAAGFSPIDTMRHAQAFSLYSRGAFDQPEDVSMIKSGIAYARCRLP